MATKAKQSGTSQGAAKALPDSKLLQAVRESAQEIWQAGLGAFAKAQQEGTKLFEALVKEGEDLSKKTRSIAEGKINEVTGNVSKAATQISSKAQASANEAWDKLEQVFEDRVARALNRLGVPTQRDVQSLAKRVEELTASVHALSGGPAARKAPAKKATAKKAAAKKPAPRRAA
ncbi:MAG: phasin family protein [Burkholderiales bacterium]|nr:phasin family protein [Burkholderiales bacterium]